MDRLLSRPQYLAVAKGRKAGRPALLLQALSRDSADGPPRFGFTVTKKTGNAVVRNRIRRRLKEAVRRIGRSAAAPGTDYVLVGRRGAVDRSFERILSDLSGALADVRSGTQSSSRERRAEV